MPKYFIFKNLSTSWQQLLVWPKTQKGSAHDPASVQKLIWNPVLSLWTSLLLKCPTPPQSEHLAQAKADTGVLHWGGDAGIPSFWVGFLIHDKDKQKEQTPAEAIRQVATANSSPDAHSTRKLPPNSPIFCRSCVPASLTTCKCHLLLKPH